MATIKASGLPARSITLRNADLLEKKGERNIFDAWILRYDEMMKLGLTPSKLHKLYASDDKRLTDYSVGAFEKYLSAIKRAVKKYGSADNAVKAYLKDTRKTYVEIFYFIKWAPEGQRAKATKPAPKVIEREAMKYSVKELEAMLAFRKNAMKK
jgi:hypothetical protein